MKQMFLSFVLFALSSMVFAHEGGHGEVAEGGKFGGITAPVVGLEQMKKGDYSNPAMKAEFVRTSSGQVSLYLFDPEMKLLSLKEFGEKVIAKVEVKKKGKFTYVGEFTLTKDGTHFSGKLPAMKQKPYNLDLTFTKGQKKFFVGFLNLD